MRIAELSLDPRIGVGSTLDSLTVRIEPVPALEGHVAVPGDKSISHRAVLLGAVSGGRDARGGLRALGGHRVDDRRGARSASTSSTRAPTRCGCAASALRLRSGDAPIDCGNSGTLMRLVARAARGQEARVELVVGDASLSSRPMERIAEPLRRMGATVETTDGHAPLVLQEAAARNRLRASRSRRRR
jgi:3-phosphoshikimate 1-carboxyvinyltransferase